MDWGEAIGDGKWLSEYFYEAACCQAPFFFTRWLLLQLSIELAASLYVKPVFASNELLSVLASFARHLMLYSPIGDSGSAGVSGPI